MKELKINTSCHDVLLTARKNHPAVFIDGMFIDGVQKMVFINNFEEDSCEVSITFNERLKNNTFPLNDINLLEKLFGPTSDGKSLRDILIQRLEGDDLYQDHQRN